MVDRHFRIWRSLVKPGDSPAAQAFAYHAAGEIAAWQQREELTQAEFDRLTEPYHTFLAIMRENDVEDAERTAAGRDDRREG